MGTARVETARLIAGELSWIRAILVQVIRMIKSGEARLISLQGRRARPLGAHDSPRLSGRPKEHLGKHLPSRPSNDGSRRRGSVMLKAECFYKPHMFNGVMASADGPIKTFPLRGIKDSPPYLHDGRLLTLEDTVEFFLT